METTLYRLWILVWLSSTVACSASHPAGGDGGAPPDAGTQDTGSADAGPPDTGPVLDVGADSGPPVDACTPDCGIRACGEDGCGGSCGGPSCVPGFESFEGLVPRVITDFDNIVPTPFTFASGVSLTGPVPNDYGTQSALIVECFGGGGFFGFTCAADGASIPDGTAFLGSAGLASYDIEFTLPEPVGTVRLRASRTGGALDRDVTMDAYDGAGALVDTSTVFPVPVGSWRDNVLVVQDPTGTRSIRRVVLTSAGASWGFDLLEWE